MILREVMGFFFVQINRENMIEDFLTQRFQKIIFGFKMRVKSGPSYVTQKTTVRIMIIISDIFLFTIPDKLNIISASIINLCDSDFNRPVEIIESILLAVVRCD